MGSHSDSAQKAWLGARDPSVRERRPQTPVIHVSPFPKTLPPIKNQQPLNPPVSWNLKIPKKEVFWLCPQPPSPDVLCLGLTARAHATDYFLANFFSDFPQHFLHR